MSYPLLTFDDVLIVPKFSTIASRKDVTLETKVGPSSGYHELLRLPIISSNMDTVTGAEMAMAMAKHGAIGCLHRFNTVEENLKMLSDSRFGFECPQMPMVSIGLGKEELERGVALWQAGASIIVIDVAHGAQQAVADQANALRGLLPKAYIMVGNFGSAISVEEFLYRSVGAVDAIKVGIGPGSACTTRIKTGVGMPQLSAIQQIAKLLKGHPIQVVADGGMKTPGDIAKALGAGAHMVMLGGMLAGTEETPGELTFSSGKPIPASREEFSLLDADLEKNGKFKKYRGSASQESYDAQGKTGSHRTSEGESFLVPYKGPVADILADIEGGIRGAMTLVGARNLDEFRKLCEFSQVSPATGRENGAHGKT